MENVIFSLYEINNKIKSAIKYSMPNGVWIKAEISEAHTNISGHCYLELIEKDDKNNIIARQKGTIWNSAYKIISAYFQEVTSLQIQAGISILVYCHVEMHENYGLSLNITDINPEYTIGKIEADKSIIIKKLEKDGVLNLNKELDFPPLPQRIAVISSQTAAGYEDFCHQLENNEFNYRYQTTLFTAYMQGDHAEESITDALNDIYNKIDTFDVVAIMRGGGAVSDLSVFNSYILASHIAQFPIPVICGIGHQRDESVMDIVAYKSLKTPTAVAEFIISKVNYQENKINELSNTINSLSEQIITSHKQDLQRIAYRISLYPKNIIQQEEKKTQNYIYRIKNAMSLELTKAEQYLEMQILSIKYNSKASIDRKIDTINKKERTIQLLSPQTILNRGYSFVKQKGKLVKSKNNIDKNVPVDIIFHDGKVTINK